MRHRQSRLIIAAALVFVAAVAFAVSVHFVEGPTFTTQDLTLLMTGKLAGLGNENLTVEVRAIGIPAIDCINPGSGEHRPPGQQPGSLEVIGSQSIPASSIKNGHVRVSVSTLAPADPNPVTAGCPNQNWLADITAIDFSSATITVLQGGETTTFGPFDL